jgi:hypothetical protein
MTERPPKRVIGWNGTCPHCRKPIRFRLETDYGSFGTTEPDEEWLLSLSEKDREFLRIAEASGVLDSFQQALKARSIGDLSVRNPAKTFLRFLAKMKTQKLTPQVGLTLRSAFPGGGVDVYTCGDISAITISGVLRLFIPTEHLFKNNVKPVANVGNGTVKVKELQDDMKDFQAWIKTRMGYVPQGGGLFLQEMRKRCYGAFGLPDQPVKASRTGVKQ